MKVRTKLMIGFLVIFSLIWGVILFTENTYTRINEEFELLKEDIIPSAVKMTDMEDHAQEVKHWTVLYIARSDKVIKELLQESMVSLEKLVMEYKEYEIKFSLVEQKAAEELENNVKQLNSAALEIVDLKDQGAGIDELTTKMEVSFDPVFLILTNELRTYKSVYIEKLSASGEVAFEAYTSGRRSLFLFAGLITLLAAVIIFFTTRSIIRPLRSLHKGTEIIGQGNLDYKVGTKAKDEIGQLSRAFDQMTEALSSTTTSVSNLNKEIAERKQAETELKEQKELIDRILASIPNSVAVLNENQQILLVNRAFEDMFKVKESDLKGKQIGEVIQIDDLTDAIAELQTSENIDFVNEYIYKLSEVDRILKIQVIPMRDKELLLLINDITEERDRQDRLLLTDRLASVGEMASGVAHELNNPLTSVIGLSQLLVDEDMPEETKEDVKAIYSEAQRAAAIVRNLLTFARKHAPLRELIQINKIVEDVLLLRAYEHKVNNINVDTQFDPELPEITVDYFQMQQVFLNIVLNAENVMIEAHKQGTLTVNTERDNSRIRVSFTDDGPGIPSENLTRIFDPFFTTKEVGKGTGLGLSICYGIVTTHGGKIYARNNPDNGASFIVELPIKN